MAQKIKVQDGYIVYEASDPAYDVNFNIKGQLVVDKNIVVGDSSNLSGTITTSSGQNLTLTTGTGGNLILQPTGAIIINGTVWPSGVPNVTSGSFLGASAQNTLAFYPFFAGYNGSDSLTISDLNTLYSTIQPGQSIIGPTVVYESIGSGQWRILQPRLGFTPVNNAGNSNIGDPLMTGLL